MALPTLRVRVFAIGTADAIEGITGKADTAAARQKKRGNDFIGPRRLRSVRCTRLSRRTGDTRLTLNSTGNAAGLQSQDVPNHEMCADEGNAAAVVEWSRAGVGVQSVSSSEWPRLLSSEHGKRWRTTSGGTKTGGDLSTAALLPPSLFELRRTSR